jgi:spermidine synthase
MTNINTWEGLLLQQLPKWIMKKNGELWFTEYEKDNLELHYRIKDILYVKESPFQQIMILDSYDFGKMLVLDDAIQTTAADGFIYNEMITHVPLSIHKNPKRVLIIGGGDVGAAREVAKHPEIEQIDMVEIDELVVKACKEHLPEVSGNLTDPRVNFIFQDGVEFVQDAEPIYDIAIIDSSDPVGPAKQLFETEFYMNLSKSLKEDGLMVCLSQSPFLDAVSMKTICTKLKVVFPIVRPYMAVVPTYPAGMWSFTIGSKQYSQPTKKELPEDTRYFNSDILEACFKLPEFVRKNLEGIAFTETEGSSGSQD